MKTKANKAKRPDIFEAAREGDVETVRACLDAGANVKAVNDYGFTALQCAAMGANSTERRKNLAILKLLLDAGSPLKYVGKGGRTALYLAAEFSPSVHPVQLLLDRGARADETGEDGIVENAMTPAVKRLLAKVLGEPVPKPEKKARPIKFSPADWRAAKPKLNKVFAVLSAKGLVALQNAGTTQEDAFADCSQVWHERGGKAAKLKGFCFYTSQDLGRAKKIGELSLAFWGAPAGADKDMRRIGTLIVEAFRDAGFQVAWNGTGGERPNVYLKMESRK